MVHARFARRNAVGAIGRRDGDGRKLNLRIERLDLLVVPHPDLAQIHLSNQRTGELELVSVNAGNVHRDDHRADDDGKLNEIILLKAIRRHGIVGRAEIDRAVDDLRHARAGTDRLIVQLVAALR